MLIGTNNSRLNIRLRKSLRISVIAFLAVFISSGISLAQKEVSYKENERGRYVEERVPRYDGEEGYKIREIYSGGLVIEKIYAVDENMNQYLQKETCSDGTVRIFDKRWRMVEEQNLEDHYVCSYHPTDDGDPEGVIRTKRYIGGKQKGVKIVEVSSVDPEKKWLPRKYLYFGPDGKLDKDRSYVVRRYKHRNSGVVQKVLRISGAEEVSDAGQPGVKRYETVRIEENRNEGTAVCRKWIRETIDKSEDLEQMTGITIVTDLGIDKRVITENVKISKALVSKADRSERFYLLLSRVTENSYRDLGGHKILSARSVETIDYSTFQDLILVRERKTLVEMVFDDEERILSEMARVLNYKSGFKVVSTDIYQKANEYGPGGERLREDEWENGYKGLKKDPANDDRIISELNKAAWKLRGSQGKLALFLGGGAVVLLLIIGSFAAFPKAGLMVALFSAVVPFHINFADYQTAALYPFDILFLALFAALIAGILIRGIGKPRIPDCFNPYFLFMAANLIGMIFIAVRGNIEISIPKSIVSFCVLSEFLVIAFISLNMARDPADLVRLSFFSVIVAAVVSVSGVIYAISNGIMFQRDSYGLYGLHPNRLGLYFAMVLPVAFALCRIEENNKRRILLVSMAMLIVLGLLLTQSRGAMTGLAVAGAMVIFRGLSRENVYKSILAVLVMIFATLLLSDIFKVSYFMQRVTPEHVSDSFSERYTYWKYAWHVFTDNMLTGLGPDNFRFFVTWRWIKDLNSLHPHSLYLYLLANLGAVSFSLFILFVIRLKNEIGIILRKSSDREYGFLLKCLAGSLIIFLVHNMVDCIYYSYAALQLGLNLGLLLSFKRLAEIHT